MRSARGHALLEPSEQPLLFLVPEQATYQAERAILSDPRIGGYHRLHILSFDRLQFLLLGRNTARPAISRIGRQMVVHKILRDNLDKLRIFSSSALLPGFAREMAATITELHQYAKNAEDIDALLKYLEDRGQKTEDGGQRTEDGNLFHPQSAILNPQSTPNRLSALKFADIALVFRRYSEALQDKFIDPDAQITSACKAVAKADFIKGARLWVDGFASFTGGEMALLMELLKAVDHAYVALCLDPADPTVLGGDARALPLTMALRHTRRPSSRPEAWQCHPSRQLWSEGRFLRADRTHVPGHARTARGGQGQGRQASDSQPGAAIS